MMSEHQPYIVGECECGAVLWHCQDWNIGRWQGGEPGHDHVVTYDLPEDEILNSEEGNNNMENLKFYYYYLRNINKEPIITVCLAQSNGDVARGIAICSLKDNPCKATGRKISRERARHAFEVKKDGCPIFRGYTMTLLRMFGRTDDFGFSKSSYCPKLTGIEKKILFHN